MNSPFEIVDDFLINHFSTSLANISNSCIAFNGGKDSTVLFHMIRIICSKLKKAMPLCIYYYNQDDFEEIKKFVDDTMIKYGCSLLIFQCSYRESMMQLNKMNIRYIFMGQRCIDINDVNKHQIIDKVSYDLDFDMFLINPLMFLSYNDIWTYLLSNGFDYCELYKNGYSSIGLKSKTKQNEHLKNPDGSWKHASELCDENFERINRI